MTVPYEYILVLTAVIDTCYTCILVWYNSFSTQTDQHIGSIAAVRQRTYFIKKNEMKYTSISLLQHFSLSLSLLLIPVCPKSNQRPPPFNSQLMCVRLIQL